MLNSRKSFKNDVRLKAQAQDFCRFTFALSVQYLMLYSTLALFYNKNNTSTKIYMYSFDFQEKMRFWRNFS